MSNYSEVSRRSFMATSAASGAALSFGLPAEAKPLTIGTDTASLPSRTMWAVGTWGEYDWQPIEAETEDDAIRLAASMDGMIDPDTGELERHYDAQRCKSWDALDGDPTPGDWLRAGMGHICSRCDHETGDFDGYAVGDEAVCSECMTLADWDIIDPEYASELREELDHE